MQKCYVLFVKAGYEENVVDRFKANSLIKPFVPVIEYFFIRNGLSVKKKKVCFKGYVFVESDLVPEEFITLLSKLAAQTKEIIRILSYGDSLDIAMRDEERAGLLNMFGPNYCLDISKAIMEGDRIKIIDGALMGMESKIKRVRLKRKEMALEIDFMGAKREIWVGLEVIEKI